MYKIIRETYLEDIIKKVNEEKLELITIIRHPAGGGLPSLHEAICRKVPKCDRCNKEMKAWKSENSD